MPTEPDNEELLRKANKKISDLREDIQRLSDELQKKDSLLSSYASRLPLLSSFMVAEEAKKLASPSASTQDTLLWDPSACPRPSCSTPVPGTAWTEVVVRGRKKRGPDGLASSRRLPLSNRYAPLADDNNSVRLAGDPARRPPPLVRDRPAPPSGTPPPQVRDGSAPPTGSTTPPQLTADRAGRAEGPADEPSKKPAARTAVSSARRKILKQAVLRRSSGSPRLVPVGNPHSNMDAAGSSRSPAHPHPPPSRPPFNPTTLIIGDSIIRQVRFSNTITRCFPGATVTDILNKLPVVLESLPSSVVRVLVHVGTNNTARRQSELTKEDFNSLLSFLRGCGKSVFISGPLPTLSRGAERFSRLLSLNTWLQFTCSAHNICFIDNFNLFWNRPAFYRPDGLHPNPLGSSMLAANMQHFTQSVPLD